MSQLNFSEGLILSCLPSAPQRYSPLRHPKTLRRKLEQVYQRMQAADFPLIKNKDYRQEMRTVWLRMNRSPSANSYHDRIDHAPYVSEYVRQKIGQFLGTAYMYNAGLIIKTSIDLNLQQAAMREARAFMREHAPRFPPRKIKIAADKEDNGQNNTQKNTSAKNIKSMSKTKAAWRKRATHANLALLLTGLPQIESHLPRLQMAAIGVENHSGRILFMQGGVKFSSNNQFNRSLHMLRQTGSTVKAILYALALEKRRDP